MSCKVLYSLHQRKHLLDIESRNLFICQTLRQLDLLRKTKSFEPRTSWFNHMHWNFWMKNEKINLFYFFTQWLNIRNRYVVLLHVPMINSYSFPIILTVINRNKLHRVRLGKKRCFDRCWRLLLSFLYWWRFSFKLKVLNSVLNNYSTGIVKCLHLGIFRT